MIIHGVTEPTSFELMDDKLFKVIRCESKILKAPGAWN